MAEGHSLLEDEIHVEHSLKRRKCIRYAAIGGTLVIVAAGLGLIIDAALDRQSPALANEVRLDAMMATLRDLEQVAIDSVPQGEQPTRAVGTLGFNATREYILGRIQAETNLVWEVQPFELLISRELQESRFASVAPGGGATTDYRLGVDFNTMSYQGSGDITAPLEGVPGLGCDASNFTAFPSGSVAIIQRGECSFGTKASLAQAAGAVGCVIYNNIEGGLSGTLGSPVGIPVFGTPRQFGEALLALPAGTELEMFSDVETATVACSNILADTTTGSSDSIVVAGSHMDSVFAGPGINDNGSGSAALLEIAIQTAKRDGLRNKVRFAWWGAEEEGLVGSEHYVQTLLSGEEQVLGTTNISQIALNLNFDMIGSPNYIWAVYNGSSGDTDERTTYGSARIQEVFEQYLTDNDHPFVLTAFDGRSDYGPFIARDANVPAGGLFTGAENAKSVQERGLFGGLANAAYDPCYHQSCDTVDNISPESMDTMAKAAAHSVSFFSNQANLQQWLTPPAATARLDDRVDDVRVQHKVAPRRRHRTARDSV